MEGGGPRSLPFVASSFFKALNLFIFNSQLMVSLKDSDAL